MEDSHAMLLIYSSIGFIVIAVVARLLLDKQRKLAVIKAGESFGFHYLAKDEALPVELAALVDCSKRGCPVILRGSINGYAAGFFDLRRGQGEDWFYQSVVVVTNPEITLPKFKIVTSQWLLILNPKIRKNAVELPGRKKEMGSVRLLADDPQGAAQIFSKATAQFFQRLRDGNWTIESLGHSLAVYRWGEQIPAHKLEEYIRQSTALAREIYSLV